MSWSYIFKDDELEAFVADIRTSLGGENENAIIDALRAASVLMKNIQNPLQQRNY